MMVPERSLIQFPNFFLGSFKSQNSKLLICTTYYSRTVGIGISFMCACVVFFFSSVGPSNFTTRKGPNNAHGKDATFDVLPSQKPFVVQIEGALF